MRRLITGITITALLLAAPGPAVHAIVAKTVVNVNANVTATPAGAGAAVLGLNSKAGLILPANGMPLSLENALPSASLETPVILPAALKAISTVESVKADESVHAASNGAPVKVAPSVSAADTGHEAAPEKTALNRLTVAVAGIPRLLGLKGAGLKAASGKTFDNAKARADTAVSPSAGFTVRARSTAFQRRLDAALPRVDARSGLSASKLKATDTTVTAGDNAGDVPAPKQKLSRAVRIGALTAILMLALDTAVMAAAVYLGYDFHPSYEMPALSDPAAFAALGDTAAMILSKAQELFSAAIVAPFNEEVYFRAGVIGLTGYGATRMVRGAVKLLEKIRPKFAKLRSWVVPAAFGIAATEAAMFFALLHEMSDPILIGVRIIQALLLSYLYVREGLMSGMVHHAVFNALAVLTLPVIYAVVAGTTTILAPQAMMVAAALAVAAYLLWKFTRSAARTEAREMREGRLTAYRLGERASTWLGRAGWAMVAILAGLALIQPAAVGAVMLGSMAAQVAPAALALSAYGFLLRNLERREGAAAVAAIRNPKDPLSMGNRVGAWVGGVFGGIYFGVIGGSFLLQGALALLPQQSLPMVLAAAAALPVLALLGIIGYRLYAGKRGIPPWLYVAQYFFGASAAVLAAIPWLAPALQRLQEVLASTSMNTTLIMPALASLAWMVPLFAAMAALMTYVARRIMRRSPPKTSE